MSITPMMQQYLETKKQYKDCIIFYRLGDFYEMFFEDAEVVAHALELTLTGKSAGLEEKVPMCGIPHHAAEIYIDKLIKKGYKVAICEQLEDPKTAKGIVKRDIVEVISSGTVINTNSLNEKENNYIGCLYDFSYGFVLTYSDITTGEVYSELLTNNTDDVIYKILSLDIKELIVNELINKVLLSKIRSLKIPVTIQNELLNDKYQNIYQNISDARIVNSIKLLLYYLDVLQKRNLSHFQEVVIKEKEQYLEMDIHTKRNLELTECLRTKERTYSLLWLLDNTKTAMGSRKLKYFIENPLLDINKINKRYDIVSKLLEEFILAEELRNDLYEVYDLERLCGKLSFGSANGKDLLQLKASLKVLPSIKEKLEKIGFYEKITTMSDLYDLLEKSIYEEPPNTIKEGYLIKDGYSSELDELKDLSRGGKDFISRFETEERERTGIKGLKVGFNKVFGYYIEVTKSYLNLIKDEFGYIRKQTTSNSERYITEELKEREALILRSDERSIELESELFNEIRNICKGYASKLQKVAQIVSEIDMLIAFNIVAKTNNYVRPTFSLYDELEIVGGRHPVIEVNLDKPFIPNDLILYNNDKILLITGPNMSGKSTYMRQNAIIAIMAQMGSFVPATYAKLPIFDQIFTRIGSSDDIVSGESTFMTEMLEVNYALQNATERSLIILDEVGRGTATFDGMALAQAIIEHIHFVTKAKTLFSTHYHELTSLDQSLPFLKNVHVEANASNFDKTGELVFLHKVLDGPSDQSYGINVASLAKIPTDVTLRAQDLLEKLEAKSNIDKKTLSIENYHKPIVQVVEKNTKEADDVLNLLKSLNPDDMKPIDALVALSKLKAMVNEDE